MQRDDDVPRAAPVDASLAPTLASPTPVYDVLVASPDSPAAAVAATGSPASALASLPRRARALQRDVAAGARTRLAAFGASALPASASVVVSSVLAGAAAGSALAGAGSMLVAATTAPLALWPAARWLPMSAAGSAIALCCGAVGLAQVGLLSATAAATLPAAALITGYAPGRRDAPELDEPAPDAPCAAALPGPKRPG